MNKIEKFKILIRLALIDNQFEDSERKLIEDFAKLQQIDDAELEALIQEELKNKGQTQGPIMVDLDFDKKIEILTDLVKVMKVDGKVYLSEIRFCEMIAKSFGFEAKSIGLLSEIVHTEVPLDWVSIQNRMKKYVV